LLVQTPFNKFLLLKIGPKSNASPSKKPTHFVATPLLRERERETERDRQTDRQRDRDRD